MGGAGLAPRPGNKRRIASNPATAGQYAAITAGAPTMTAAATAAMTAAAAAAALQQQTKTKASKLLANATTKLGTLNSILPGQIAALQKQVMQYITQAKQISKDPTITTQADQLKQQTNTRVKAKQQKVLAELRLEREKQEKLLQVAKTKPLPPSGAKQMWMTAAARIKQQKASGAKLTPKPGNRNGNGIPNRINKNPGVANVPAAAGAMAGGTTGMHKVVFGGVQKQHGVVQQQRGVQRGVQQKWTGPVQQQRGVQRWSGGPVQQGGGRRGVQVGRQRR